MKLILVRHGETLWNRNGLYQGQNQIGLTSTGFWQAQQVARNLSDLKPQTIYSSPLRRAIQTAQSIAQKESSNIVSINGLMELDLGKIQGLTSKEIQTNYPHIYDSWRKDPSSIEMPGGESLETLQNRSWESIQTIKDSHSVKIAICVTHNFTIKTIVCRVLNLALSEFHNIRVDLGSLPRWRQTQRNGN